MIIKRSDSTANLVQAANDELPDHFRRQLVRHSWVAPITLAVTLPAHAVTSSCSGRLTAPAFSISGTAAVTVDVFYSIVYGADNCPLLMRSETQQIGQPLTIQFRLLLQPSVTFTNGTMSSALSQQLGVGQMPLPDLSQIVSFQIVDQRNLSWNVSSTISRTSTSLSYSEVVFTRA